MRRAVYRRTATGMSLFPFLAVLICTMGALIVLLVMVLQQARVQASTTPAASAEPTAEQVAEERKLRESKEDLDWRREMLMKQREGQATELSNTRKELSHLEDHIRRLQEQAKQIDNQVNELNKLGESGSQGQNDLKTELARLQFHIETAKRLLDEAKKKANSKPRSYAIIPYQGPNGTKRRPIYIECSEEGITIYPENIVLRPADFEGPLGPGNPLDAALRTIREYLVKTDNLKKDGEPYPLLLVRPNGSTAYNIARVSMKSWDDEFGYELIDDKMALRFPPPDPVLEELLLRTLVDARSRQAALAAAMPTRYSHRDPQGFVANSRGGFTPVQPSDDQATSLQGSRGGGGGGGGGRGFGGTSGNGYGAGGNGIGGNGTGGNGSGGFGNSQLAQGNGPGGQVPASQGFGGPGGNGYGGTGPGGTGSGGTGPFGPGGTGQYGPGAGGFGPGGNGQGGPGQGGAGQGGTGPYGPGGAGQFGAGSGGSGPSAPGQGGAGGQSGTGAQGGTAAGQGGAGGQGSGTGQGGNGGQGGPNGQGGSSGQGGQSGTTTGYGDVNPNQSAGGGSSGQSGQSGGMNSFSYNAGQSGSSNGSSSNSSNSSSGSSGSSSGSSNSSSSSSGGGSSSSATESLARHKGHDWALKNKESYSTGITRPIRVQCFSDRLVILSEKGDAQRPIVIQLKNGYVRSSAEEFVAGIWKHMEPWGLAVKGGYWKPILRVEVAPGADPQYAQLEGVLRDSGLDVQRK